MEYFKKEYFNNNERGFYVPHALIGAPTSPQTANQIQEASSRLNAGVKNIELSLVSPEVFETIPKQHFDEISNMSKLTGASVSLHAPAQMDLAGFSKEGWSESSKSQVEKTMQNIIDRGAQLGKNAIINVHSSGGIPAFEWQKEKTLGEEKYSPPDEKRKIFVIDQSNPGRQGSIAPLEYEEKEYFGGTKVWTPEERRRMINQSTWDQEKLQLFNYEKEKAEINDRLNMTDAQIAPLMEGYNKKVLTEDESKKLGGLMKQKQVMEGHINELNVHMDTQMEDLHDKFSRYAPDKEKELFDRKYGKAYKELFDFTKTELKFKDEYKNILEKSGKDEKKLKLELEKLEKKYGKSFLEDLNNEKKEQERRQSLLNSIQNMPIPERFISTDKFAKDKLSDTVAKSALYGYDKYKDRAPIISVENVYPDWTLGRAESLKEAVEESREKFAKKLREEKHISKEKAEEISKKLIGATWDVGHINQLRKFGYSDKDIAREAEKIAPVVKHIHITDNFGFNDTHLPPGYGTVPIKEQLEKLKSKLGEEYNKVAHIVEAGGFVAQFKTSPHLPTLEYFGSPLYEMKAEPYWSNIAYTHAEYNMGYGLMFPEKHFDLYGSGFSNLPQELGGQVSGEKSRFAGTPND